MLIPASAAPDVSASAAWRRAACGRLAIKSLREDGDTEIFLRQWDEQSQHYAYVRNVG